ncbi:MAG: hypothetical protein CMJ58_25390 [Planctomycetaceae bacterium]|nr:hypothetical protein [Planctomycetaceae bacterium]
MQLLREIHPGWALLLGIPAAAAISAWALQIACEFCTVQRPKFWHAVAIVVVGALTNVSLRYFLPLMGFQSAFATETIAGLITTAMVIVVGVGTGPFTAVTIVVVQMTLCAVIYTGLAWLANPN